MQPISATDLSYRSRGGSAAHGLSCGAGQGCCPARPTGCSSGRSGAGADCESHRRGDPRRPPDRCVRVVMSGARTIVLGASHWHVPLYAEAIAEVHSVVGLSDDDPDRVGDLVELCSSRVFSSERWERLEALDARPQRPLWANRACLGGEGQPVRLGPLGRPHRRDHRHEHLRRVRSDEGPAGQVRVHHRTHLAAARAQLGLDHTEVPGVTLEPSDR
jgi:hypothetical protein